MARRFLITLLTFLAVTGVHAEEVSLAALSTDSAQVLPAKDGAIASLAADPLSAITLEPGQHVVASPSPAHIKTIKAEKHVAAKSMLSRAAREQIALYKTAAQIDDPTRHIATDDDDDDPGLDDLDLHRSFSRPRVAAEKFSFDDDGSALPAHIRLRLLMARTKAVDAHILNQAAKTAAASDEPLSDTVKLRLFMARNRAMAAYHKKFGEA